MQAEIVSSSSERIAGGRRRSPVRIIALALLVPAVAGGAYVVATRRPFPAAAQAQAPGHEAPSAPETGGGVPEVSLAAVATGSFSQAIRVTGSLKSDEVIELSTKATGMVREVTVREGDRVRRGQLLVRLDDSEVRAQRDRSLAAIQVAESKLKQASTSRDIKNSAAESDFRRAEETLSAARTRLLQAQSLAQITATESETAVTAAKSALQAARERLKVLQDGSRKQERAAAELAVSRAKAQADKLKANLERREQLLREGAIALEEVENARRDHQMALAELNSAKQQSDLVAEGPRSEEIRQAEEAVRQAEATLRNAEANRTRRQISDQDVEAAQAAVRQAEAGLDAAKAALAQKEWNSDEIRSAQASLAQAKADARYYAELLKQTTVYSPVNGVVTARKINVGESVLQMKSDMMTLVSTDTVYFEATAPENVLPYLREGSRASVTLDALPGRTLAGVVREIIPVADGTDRSVRLRISVPRPERFAVVGGFARATIQGVARGATLSVPAAAVATDEGQRVVFIYEDGKARRQPVRVGATSGDRLEVLSGLTAGQQIIVTGADALVDGQEVKAL